VSYGVWPKVKEMETNDPSGTDFRPISFSEYMVEGNVLSMHNAYNKNLNKRPKRYLKNV